MTRPKKASAKNVLGDTLLVFGALSFIFLCMILPLVGQAGVATAYAGKSSVAFIAMCLLCLVFLGGASVSKIRFSRRTSAPRPSWSLGLFGVCLCLLLLHLSGWLSI